MSPQDLGGGILAERPVGSAFNNSAPLKTNEQQRARELQARISARIKAGQEADPYRKKVEELKKGGRSGVINYHTKEFYIYECFIGRNFDTAKKLARELKEIFGDTPPEGFGWKERMTWDNLFNPKWVEQKEGSTIPPVQTFNSAEVRDMFQNMMRRAGYKSANFRSDLASTPRAPV